MHGGMCYFDVASIDMTKEGLGLSDLLPSDNDHTSVTIALWWQQREVKVKYSTDYLMWFSLDAFVTVSMAVNFPYINIINMYIFEREFTSRIVYY